MTERLTEGPYLVGLLYVYHMCTLCPEYLYVMICHVMLCYIMLCVRFLVLKISVPSLTLCCSVHLTKKDLNLET